MNLTTFTPHKRGTVIRASSGGDSVSPSLATNETTVTAAGYATVPVDGRDVLIEQQNIHNVHYGLNDSSITSASSYIGVVGYVTESPRPGARKKYTVERVTDQGVIERLQEMRIWVPENATTTIAGDSGTLKVGRAKVIIIEGQEVAIQSKTQISPNEPNARYVYVAGYVVTRPEHRQRQYVVMPIANPDTRANIAEQMSERGFTTTRFLGTAPVVQEWPPKQGSRVIVEHLGGGWTSTMEAHGRERFGVF